MHILDIRRREVRQRRDLAGSRTIVTEVTRTGRRFLSGSQQSGLTAHQAKPRAWMPFYTLTYSRSTAIRSLFHKQEVTGKKTRTGNAVVTHDDPTISVESTI